MRTNQLSRRTLLIGTVAALSLVSQDAARAGDDIANPEILIEAVIDNGGTVQDPAAAVQIKNLIRGLTTLSGRAYRNARIDLILTSDPRTVWSGTPRDLTRDAGAILDLIALNDRCSDLPRALR